VDPTKAPNPPHNGAIHTLSNSMTTVVSPAAEAELDSTFLNGKDGTILRTTLLHDMGHPQPATPNKTCAVGIANDTIRQRRSKAIDMRFYWSKGRPAQGHFIVYWKDAPP
jgi:hypothetical protein